MAPIMKRILSACLLIGAVLTLVGVAVYITGWTYSPYLYLVGSVLVAIAQIFLCPRSDDFVVRRLYRQQIIGALILVASAAMMLTLHNNEWMLALAVASFIELYTSFRLGSAE